MEEKHGIKVILPVDEEREILHSIISNELCSGIMKQDSKEKIKKIMEGLIRRGAKGIILGCTELPLIIKQEDVDVLIFDTTRIHAISAIEYAIEN